MSRLSPPSVAVALAVVFSCTAIPAQEWRKEPLTSVGLEIDAPGRLERLPMQLGEGAVYQRARFRPKDNQDFVRSQYYWYCDVYEFSSKKGGDDADLPAGVPEEMKEQLKKLMAEHGFARKTTFKEWFEDENKGKKDTLTVEVAGKPRKGKAGKLDHVHWVWRERSGFGPCGVVYCEAAVYSFPEREVAIVIEMPLETEKPGIPKSKWKSIIDRVIPSGTELAADANGDDVDKKRDQYANTPERQQALAAAKKNIADMKGWDYFTSPNYIVIYSWDFEKPDERGKSRKDAEYYSSRLEKMRELYLKAYPLDESGTKAVFPDPKSIPELGGPTTGPKPEKAAEAEEERESKKDELGTLRYPVFRLCATYEQFQKYGQSPPGVVGWFSPMSKELVVFLGGDKMMGQGATETVTYHEGWHQYADFYFDHPQTARRGSLHRWFDEGHGDYFGSFRWGQQGWKYVGSKMRYADCKQMVRQGDYVPFRDIVHWDRQRFYAKNAPYYYAQAYSMVDFLRRGDKEKGWDARWGEALDMYRKVILVHGQSKLASDTAFRGFTDADWKALEEAWKAWVSGPKFLNGA
ncbi:MAG: hypothetical protein WAT39_26410 [Planctomycetota bacterium]